MGKTFRYIADKALEAMDPDSYTECQVCERRGVPVFTAHGRAPLAEGGHRDVYSACAKCLRAASIEQIDEWATDEVIEAYARRYASKAGPKRVRRLQLELKNKLRRIPHVAPQAQRTDWPLCCGDLTEYTGSPRKRAEWERLTRTALGWRRAEVLEPDADDVDEPDDEWPEWHPWLADFIPVDSGDELPSLGAFATFRCLKCDKVYWTFQCS